MGYRERVLRDLDVWRKEGWVSAEGAASIAASLPERRSISFPAIMGMLGAILLGAGLIALVAANWEEIPRLWRLGGALAIMAVAYAIAAPLKKRHWFFAEAALIVAAAAFAGALALVGQTYHMGDDFNALIFLWIVGILAAAYLLTSNVMVVVGLAGGVVWSWAAMETGNGEHVHWPGLLPILVSGALGTLFSSLAAQVLAVLALFLWLLLAVIAAVSDLDHALSIAAAAYVLSSLAVLSGGLLVAALPSERLSQLGVAALWPALLASLIALGVLQLATDPAPTSPLMFSWGAGTALIALAAALIARARGTLAVAHLIWMAVLVIAAIGFALFVPSNELVAGLIGAAIVLAATVWAVNLGRDGLVPYATPTGLAAFGAEVIYIYAATLGTVLDTSVVFLAGGVLFIALAFGLYRVERMLSRGEKGGTS